MVLSVFIDKLSPFFSKHVLLKLLSQALDLQFCEVPLQLLRVSSIAETFFSSLGIPP